jgi:serine/threonine protein kinase
MHHFHLVHMDIKPENMMLSPTYNRHVFIDFGLSQLIPEKVGFESLTNFAGCISYCSTDMAKILCSQKAEYVDLFYNDLYCL